MDRTRSKEEHRGRGGEGTDPKRRVKRKMLIEKKGLGRTRSVATLESSLAEKTGGGYKIREQT